MSFKFSMCLCVMQGVMACNNETLNQNLEPTQSPTPGANVSPDPELEAGKTNMNEIPLIMISDIDDTIKASGIKAGPEDLVSSALQSDDFFGMKKLYSYYISQSPEKRNIFYVSGAPDTANLSTLTKTFLDKWDYPRKENLFNKESSGISTKDFKIERITEIIKNANPSAKFVLVGDNGEQDVQVYETITNKFPTKIMKTFIHYVYLPDEKTSEFHIGATQIPFLTSVDLALYFQSLKLIDANAVDVILNDSLKMVKDDSEEIIAEWMEKSCKDFMANLWPKVSLAEAENARVLEYREKLVKTKNCR